jgi:ABC-type enterobactin transport system permease subunit
MSVTELILAAIGLIAAYLVLNLIASTFAQFVFPMGTSDPEGDSWLQRIVFQMTRVVIVFAAIGVGAALGFWGMP